jgi:hypothetical protein
MKRKLPVKRQETSLDGDYEGWKFTFITNPPMGILRRITSGELDDIMFGVGEMVVDWNFVDEEGEPLGDPSPKTMDLLPIDLLVLMAQEIAEKVGQVPPKLESG